MRTLIIGLGLLVTSAGVVGCGASKAPQQPATTTSQQSSAGNAQQTQIGTTVGNDYIRIAQAFIRRPASEPTLDALAGNFDSWVSGKANGQEAPEIVRAAGFTSDPAPTAPLSAAARAAAAAVVVPYLRRASSPKFGLISDGYIVAYRDGKIEFRCKRRGDPQTELCMSSQWKVWQLGFASG